MENVWIFLRYEKNLLALIFNLILLSKFNAIQSKTVSFFIQMDKDHLKAFLNMYSILQVLAIHMRIRQWPFIYILVLLSLLLSFPRAFVYALQIANTIRQIFETQHVTKYYYTRESNSPKSTSLFCYC